MRKAAFALAALSLLFAVPACADNTICPTRPNGDSSNACASTQFVQGAVSGLSFVVGPASATDNALPCFDGTTGKLLKVCTAPTAPTPGSNINTTQVPTTAWVNTWFLTQANAASTYLTQANAASTYAPLTGVPVVYNTVSAATAATIPVTAATIYVRGYTTAGDAGGGWWTRNGSLPSHTAYFQSADGAYWTPSLATAAFNFEMFGGACGGTGFNNTPALNKYNSFITAVGQQRLQFQGCPYYFNTAPNSFTTAAYFAGTGNNGTVIMKNYNATVGGVFLLFNGASGVVIRDLEIGANTGTVNGYMVMFASTSSNGASGSRIDNVTISPFGTDNYERAIYVDGSNKVTGSIGSRDHNWSNLTVFGASSSSVLLYGAEGLSWSGGGIYPAGGTGSFSGSLQLSGTAGVPTNNVYASFAAVNNIDFDQAVNCIVRASSIAGNVTNTANTNKSSVGGPVTGTKAANWLNGNYTVN